MTKVLISVALVLPLLASAQDVKSASSATLSYKVAKLAYDRLTGTLPYPQDDIFILDSPNSKPRHLGTGMSPVWSPDGKKIAYCLREGIGTRNIGTGQMRLINADGSGDKQLTNLEGGACPSDWSADGRLAFVSNGQILVMTTDDEHARKIAPGYGARWSPDGKRLLFCRLAADRQSSGSVWIVNEDGADAKKVIDDNSQALEATWGADGNTILFTSTRVHKRKAEIFRINLDGSGLQVVVTDPDRSLFFPLLSPDGSTLIADRIDSDEKNIVSVDLTSKRKSVLAHGLHPSVVWAAQ